MDILTKYIEEMYGFIKYENFDLTTWKFELKT
jgi:hypothetical protein